MLRSGELGQRVCFLVVDASCDRSSGVTVFLDRQGSLLVQRCESRLSTSEH